MYDAKFATSVFGEDTTVTYIVGGIVGLSYFLFLVWTVIAWGAFRKLNGLSKTRSFFAFLFAFVFSFIGMYAVFLLDLAFD